jgi:hypothetical protein
VDVFLEEKTSPCFLFWGLEPNLTNSLCFLTLFMLWLRGLGVKGKGSFADELGLGVWGKQPKGTEASPKEILRAPWSTLGKNPFGKKRTKQQGSTVLSHG